MALHKALGKILGAFKHGASLRRSNHGDVLQKVVVLEIVVNALHQRIFWTDHNHVDLVVEDKLGNAVEIVGLDVHIFAHLHRSSITRSNEELADFRALGYFPCQGVFTAAATKKKNFHDEWGYNLISIFMLSRG